MNIYLTMDFVQRPNDRQWQCVAAICNTPGLVLD
jgi:hypothetical protein